MLSRASTLVRLRPAIRALSHAVNVVKLATGVTVASEANQVWNHDRVLTIRRGSITHSLPQAEAPAVDGALEVVDAPSAVAGFTAVGVCCGVGLVVTGGLLSVLYVRRRRRRLRQLLRVQARQALPETSGTAGQLAAATAVEAALAAAQEGSAAAGLTAKCKRLDISDSAGSHKGGLLAGEEGPRTPGSTTTPCRTSLGRGGVAPLGTSPKAVLHLSGLAPARGFSIEAEQASGSPHASLPPLQSEASITHETLLARLPSLEDDWQLSIVDPGSIEFCRGPDGSLVELGRGAFSKVYRALLDGCQPHAVKVIELGEEQHLQEDFLQEVSLLRQFRHRNIVSFSGVCVADGYGFIVMELMDGRDLYSRLQSVNKAGERIFSWRNRGKMVALDVARALAYLHSRSVTHFDIKSSNVLLTRDLTAKLADVGLARTLRRSHHSLSSLAPGTFQYMAPELLMSRQCTSSVDIYSLGVLLWELCTGTHPRRGCLHDLAGTPDVPQEVADLFLECTDENPAHRPSAKQLVERLERLCQRSSNAAAGGPAAGGRG